MKLYKDQYIDFRYQEQHDLMTVKFLKSLGKLKETAKFIGAIELINAKKVLLDLSLLEEFDEDSKDLLIEDFTKQLLGHGVRRLAIVESPVQEVNEFLKQVIEKNKPPKLKFNFFKDYDSAYEWITARAV